MKCANCGALREDHMDYGRGHLTCPLVTAGIFREAKTRYVVRLRAPALWLVLAPNPHWEEDPKLATKFETFLEASLAMGGYDGLIKTFES